MSDVVHVAVGVIKQNDRYFLTQRAADVHQGGKWEFPGGKVDAGETIYQALHRELAEEIAIDVLSCVPLLVINHDYGDKKVCLEVFLVEHFMGEPAAQEGQNQQWFSLDQLHYLDLPQANKAILEKLLEN